MYTSLLSIIKTNYPLSSFLCDKVTFLRIRNIYAKEKEIQEILSSRKKKQQHFQDFLLGLFLLEKGKKIQYWILEPNSVQVTNLNKLSFLSCNSKASFQHFFMKIGGHHSTTVKNTTIQHVQGFQKAPESEYLVIFVTEDLG